MRLAWNVVAVALVVFMGFAMYIVGDEHPMIKDGLTLIEVRQVR